MSRIERFDVPTLEQLRAIEGVSDEALEKVRAVLAGEITPLAAVQAWDATLTENYGRNRGEPRFAQCFGFHKTRSHEAKLFACDILLEGSGVEALRNEDWPTYIDEGIGHCPAFSYVNFGDTYDVTLARDHAAEQWVIASWGDLAAEYEEENELDDWSTFDEEPDMCPSCHEKEFTLTACPNSSRGPSYSWVCKSCNHHCLAVKGYEPTKECAQCGDEVKLSEAWGDSYCSELCLQEARYEQ